MHRNCKFRKQNSASKTTKKDHQSVHKNNNQSNLEITKELNQSFLPEIEVNSLENENNLSLVLTPSAIFSASPVSMRTKRRTISLRTLKSKNNLREIDLTSNSTQQSNILTTKTEKKRGLHERNQLRDSVEELLSSSDNKLLTNFPKKEINRTINLRKRHPSNVRHNDSNAVMSTSPDSTPKKRGRPAGNKLGGKAKRSKSIKAALMRKERARTYIFNDGIQIKYIKTVRRFPLYDDSSNDSEFQVVAMVNYSNYHNVDVNERYTIIISAFHQFMAYYKEYTYPTDFVTFLGNNSNGRDYISNLTVLSVRKRGRSYSMTIKYENTTFKNIPYIEYQDPLLLTDPYWIKQHYFESSMLKLQELINNINLYNYPDIYVISPIDQEKCGLFPAAVYHVTNDALEKPNKCIKILWLYEDLDRQFCISESQLDVLCSPWNVLFNFMHYDELNKDMTQINNATNLHSLIEIFYNPRVIPQGIELFYDISKHNLKYNHLINQNFKAGTRKRSNTNITTTDSRDKIFYQGIDQIRASINNYSNQSKLFNDLKSIAINTKAIYPTSTMEWQCADILYEFTKKIQSDYNKFWCQGCDDPDDVTIL